MSRHPLKSTDADMVAALETEEYINRIIVDAVPKSLTIEEISEGYKSDIMFLKVMDELRNKTAIDYNLTKTSEEYCTYHKIREELSLSCVHNVLLRGTEIIIPYDLRKRTVNLAHAGHQGIVKTKQLLRAHVRFPGIDRLTEEMVSSCIPCQASVERGNVAPMISSSLPHEPWTELSCDFTGPLPSGQSLLVVIDNYSRFPVVKVISNTTASTVISELKEIFSLLGRPKSLKIDNGAPFSRGEFAKFAHEAGFNHIKVTPHWPQANGKVERIMKPLMKSIQCAKQ